MTRTVMVLVVLVAVAALGVGCGPSDEEITMKIAAEVDRQVALVPPAPPGGPGPQGEAGPQGDAGRDGLQGAQGLQGLQGDEGAQGETGPQGEMGTQGEEGLHGATGARGPRGSVGPQGEPGPAMTEELVAVIAEARHSVVIINTTFPRGETGGGTGFYVDSRGTVLTAKHVVDTNPAPLEITVTTAAGDTEFYEVLRLFAGKDAALLVPKDVSVQSTALLVAPAQVGIGTPVVSLGDKAIFMPEERPYAQFGIVSGSYHWNCDLCGESAPLRYIVDFEGGGGSSGSPVVNLKGRVIGMITRGWEVPAFGVAVDLTDESF